jgi:hypothetical protein
MLRFRLFIYVLWLCFFNRQSAFRWVPTVCIFSPIYNFSHMSKIHMTSHSMFIFYVFIGIFSFFISCGMRSHISFVHFALALSDRLPVRVKSDISKDLHSHKKRFFNKISIINTKKNNLLQSKQS